MFAASSWGNRNTVDLTSIYSIASMGFSLASGYVMRKACWAAYATHPRLTPGHSTNAALGYGPVMNKVYFGGSQLVPFHRASGTAFPPLALP